MSESFDDALDRAIDALQRGEQLDRVLARFPRHAGALRPLLETLEQARRDALSPAAMSPRLADHFSIVRAAVQRAQMPAQPLPARDAGQPPSWWQRRLTFASRSVPVGAFALLAFAGVSGAAASIAVTGDVSVPSTVMDLVKEPQHWLSGSSGGDHDNASNSRQDSPSSDGHATAGNGASASSGTATEMPGSENKPSLITLDGTVSDIHGDVFTLTTAGGVYKVNTDAKTTITGTITDGARATVTGSVTAEKNMHADTVDIAATPGANDATPTPGNDKTPGPPADRTPGPPPDKTTGPPADHTPEAPPGKTTGPPATPPGQSGSAPNGNANGNGNGGGNSKKP